MVRLMHVDKMTSIAALVGIDLKYYGCLASDSQYFDEINLYVLTDPQGLNLYVGKAASGRRHLEEDRFKYLDPDKSIVSGYVHLVQENNAQRHGFRYDPSWFNVEMARKALEYWEGKAFKNAIGTLQRGSPSVDTIERILIRIHIRAGCLIGNSRDASQWESPIESFHDTMADTAVAAAKRSGLLPR